MRAKVNPLSKVSMKQSGLDRLKENVTKKHSDRGQSHKNKTMENLPNDNIFKNDMRYKILKDISFEMVIDEESAVKDLTERHNYLATQAIPIFMLIYITDISMKTYFELFLSLVSLSLIALYIFLILDKKTEKKLIISDITRNYFYKCILEIILSNKIILSTPSDDLLLNDLIYYLLPSFFYSLSFEINIIHSIMFNFFKVNLVLVKYGNNSSDVSLTVRIITSIFSTNFFLAYFMIFWAAFVEYFIKKAIRELWALYDSFKRSYFTIKKCLMDDHPIPSIIVTNKRPNFLILYKNKQAEELFSKSPVLKSKEISDSYFKKSQNFKKEIRASPSNTSSIVNLEDIFTNEMESSFSAEIEKCISNRKRYFDFPLKIIEKSPKWVVKQVEGKRTFFKGDLSKYEWFRVVVSPCNWKNQEAIFIQLIKNEEFQANEFITGYISNINDQMNLLVGNSELVCNKVVEYEYEKSKEKCSNDQKYLKNSIDCIIMKSSPRMHEGSQKKTPESQLQSINSNKMKAPSLKKVLNVNQTMSIKNNIIFPFPKFDHSLWLFFKYNTNFVYDMNLTVQLYYAFINKKIFPPTEKIKIKEFLNYLIDYFYLISQVKNFKFVIKNLSNDEIIISYVYFRAILFNILLFILNNSNSNEEKIVEINIKNEKNFESKQDMFNFHFEIKYYDNKIKINYDTLRKILAIENLHNLIEIDKDIAKIKCIDLGMVLTNYIINYVYDNNLLLLSYGANHSISFYVKGYLHKSYYIKLASTGINYSTIKLSEPRSRLFEQYQNKILQKLYKINPTAAVKIEGVREKLWKLENREMKRTFSFNTKTPNDSDENQEIYDPKEDESQSIENDNNLVKEINISLYKHIKEHEKLIKQKRDKNIRTKIERLKEQGVNRKFSNPIIKFPTMTDVHLKWDSTSTNILGYFYPPRILIVEDTSLGRVALIGILKSYKLNVLIDIAACGYEAIQKYKFFLRKGFIYDIIFMDYNLPDMLGSEATQVIRDYEVEYSINKTNICAVSVDPEKVVMKDHMFDGYIEKPVRNEQFYDYITNIIAKNRPDIKLCSTH